MLESYVLTVLVILCMKTKDTIFVVSDMKILKFSSLGETDETKLGEMIGNHGALLKQAMKCKLNFVLVISSQ